MTREVKLSLIFGFALVLVVGVLLSDHLSGARRASVNGLNPERSLERPAASVPSPAPELILVDERGQVIPPQPARRQEPLPVDQPKITSNPASLVARADEAPKGNADGSMIDQIRDRFAQGLTTAIDDISDGRSIPGAAQIDPLLEPEPVSKDRRGGISWLEATPETTAPAEQNDASAAGGSTRLYQVQEGETLWSIANTQLGDGSRHKEIIELNRDRLGPGNMLRAGSSIRLPSTTSEPAKTAPRITPTPRRTVLADNNRNNDPADEPAPPSKRSKSTYTVRTGDTLGKIASKLLGSSARSTDILAANTSTLSDEDTLEPGMVLTIPPR